MRGVQKLIGYLLFLAAVMLLVSWRQKTLLPDSRLMSDALQSDPLQVPLNAEPFPFSYMGTTYTVEPVAEYELQGLVVTHNNTRGWADIYHDETSVDIKDLCVIWGENVRNNIHNEISFWSNTWTCYFKTDSREVFKRFRQEQLSNNHLISPHEKVRKAIFRVAVGDQVRIRGMLVNYYPQGRSDLSRKTSTLRNDTGNGACEVVLVEDLELIKEGNPGWRRIFRISRMATILLTVLWIGVFLFQVYAEQRKVVQEIEAHRRRRRMSSRSFKVPQ